LPIYEQITRNQPHSVGSEIDKKRIDMIYQTYGMNPKTGEFLLGSNIVSLIQNTYKHLNNRSYSNEKEVQQNLNDFKEEYIRLKQNWYSTLMN